MRAEKMSEEKRPEFKHPEIKCPFSHLSLFGLTSWISRLRLKLFKFSLILMIASNFFMFYDFNILSGAYFLAVMIL